MKNTYFLSLILCILSFNAFAHLGEINGTVFDNATKQPLKGATVILSGTGKATVTNELGQYQFSGLTVASFKLEISHIGFKTQILTVAVLEDQTTFVKTYMDVSRIELSEVVVSSGRAHDQQLISSLDIKLRPINNSQEILRMVPGLFIGQHAGGGKAEQIFLRGFDLDHGTDIRLTVDGMPVNMVSHAHGQGYADLHFVIPELVQGVDFKKGPYQADKGNFTTAGWVDFRTRTALDKSMFKLEAGQFDTYRAMAAIDLLGEKLKEKNQSAYIASEYSYTNSYFDNPQNFKRLNIFGKYHGHISKNTNVNFTASTFWSKWNHSGQIPDRAVESGMIDFFGSIDPSEGGETSRTNVNAEFVTVTPKQHVIKNQFFYSNYNFELYSNFTFFKEDTINGDQIRQKEKRNLFGYNGSFSSFYTLGKTKITSTFGLNYRQDITHNTELSHTKDRSVTLERKMYGNINEINVGAYVDELVQFSDRFSMNAGVRIDFFNNRYEDLLNNPVELKKADDYTISPKLNFYYTFNPQLQLYLNTGKGFHSNDTRVVVAQAGKQILPAAYGSDLGIIFKPFPKLLINAAAWYLWLDQEFVYVGDEGVVEPSGQSRREGIDLSVRYQLTRTLFADVDFNATKPRAIGQPEGQSYLPLAPIITTMGGLTLQGKKGFSGSLRYRYVGDRPANEDNSIVARGYFVTDGQLNYTRQKYTLGLSIQNILNTRWKETQFATESRLKGEKEPIEEIHFTPGTPFSAKLSLTYFF
ncbi:Outer membrane receptor proteins, mostly Fe transport [Pseudarcicella hirudinis]|uniref:Outer membrane receptor proteins, mostly Fe transport n=1 Tax=Pseudarcicella hirudinis TaxID=1079859 RepID=A0A1I5NV40_9BACT|nr:TonB-dependent receptor [Pseudarcicella hirudinis]SFP25664.1 Outer membrane receptor proteins, mostly Fe transport [Pseudarcicella hirudinis]